MIAPSANLARVTINPPCLLSTTVSAISSELLSDDVARNVTCMRLLTRTPRRTYSISFWTNRARQVRQESSRLLNLTPQDFLDGVCTTTARVDMVCPVGKLNSRF